MSANTKIEWADHTFNPWIGCTKVSPGCDHCYAEADFDHRKHRVKWGAGQQRSRTSDANWRQPLKWNAEAAHLGIRYRVFCASLADVFDNEVPHRWRQDLMSLIADTPHLDGLLLTKRIGNAKRMLSDASMHDGRLLTANDEYRPPDNLWIGATICNQEEADRDIPKLLATPTAKRFLSMEPLLGPVDLVRAGALWSDMNGNIHPEFQRVRQHIDWVIVGGESGHGARPMHPDWARSLRDQCQAAGVPFLFKQWGEWTPGENVERQRGTIPVAHHFVDEWIVSNLNLATDGGHADDEPTVYRVGKKAAGRLLDGRTWDGAPS
jgi:protein gp37